MAPRLVRCPHPEHDHQLRQHRVVPDQHDELEQPLLAQQPDGRRVVVVVEGRRSASRRATRPVIASPGSTPASCANAPDRMPSSSDRLRPTIAPTRSCANCSPHLELRVTAATVRIATSRARSVNEVAKRTAAPSACSGSTEVRCLQHQAERSHQRPVGRREVESLRPRAATPADDGGVQRLPARIGERRMQAGQSFGHEPTMPHGWGGVRSSASNHRHLSEPADGVDRQILSRGASSAVNTPADVGRLAPCLHAARPSPRPRPGRRPPGPRRWPARPAGRSSSSPSSHTTVSVERATLRLAGLVRRRRRGHPVGQPPRRRGPRRRRPRARRRPAGLGRAASAARPTTCRRWPRRRPPARCAFRLPEGRDADARPRRRPASRSARASAAIDRRRARARAAGRSGSATPPRKPWIYLIVATGDIYEDIPQAQAAAREGADVIAVIRSTGQSLLDYVPEGATREGYAGTYATQENFRLMRAALDETSARSSAATSG